MVFYSNFKHRDSAVNFITFPQQVRGTFLCHKIFYFCGLVTLHIVWTVLLQIKNTLVVVISSHSCQKFHYLLLWFSFIVIFRGIFCNKILWRACTIVGKVLKRNFQKFKTFRVVWRNCLKIIQAKLFLLIRNIFPQL